MSTTAVDPPVKRVKPSTRILLALFTCQAVRAGRPDLARELLYRALREAKP